MYKESICRHTIGKRDNGYKFKVIGEHSKKYESFMNSSKLGLDLHGDCLTKANNMKTWCRDLIVVIGAIKVFNFNFTASYGCEYHPSTDVASSEFHAWNMDKDKTYVVDAALGGFILRGLQMKDEHGSFLEGRSACMLAGTPPEWIHYYPRAVWTNG